MGTGVGSGGDGAHAAYIAKLKSELSMGTSHLAPSNIQQNVDHLYEWCARVTRMLRREQGRALLQLQVNQLDAAKQTLKDALIVASQSLAFRPDLGSPMTKRMIDRGVVYLDGIETALSSKGANTRLDLMTLIDFMSGFVDLIIKTEAKFDRPYYIPYAYQYHRCQYGCTDPAAFDFRAFFDRYSEYAKEELNFVVTHSVNQAKQGDRLVVTPVGRAEAFLKLAELSTHLLADEISQTLQGYQHACMVSDMKLLSETLMNFNLFGDRTYFPNTRYAVEASTVEINRLLGNFNCSPYAYPGSYSNQTQSQELLRSGSMTMNNGDMRQVLLDQPRYIQKIFVQAEGRYRDAIVEVVVNGQVKGTIHLPATDPTYVVTIADTASTIELRMTSGHTVVVKSVLAILN